MRRNSSGPLHSQLEAAAEIWVQIQNDPVPADRWLGRFFHHNRKKFGSRDRRFLSETVYSLFRHRLFLETWTKTLGLSESTTLVLFAAAAEGIISPQDFTDVCQMAEAGSIYASLKNRELPGSLKVTSEEERLSLRYSFPLWLVRRWLKTFGPVETEALLASFQERPPLVIRANPLKISRDKLLARFRHKGLNVLPTTRSSSGIFFAERIGVFDMEEFQKGFFEVQDEGSQFLCELMEPKPEETIWDVCAGGGGKSLYLAALMQNKGRIIATDIRMHKLEDLKKRAKRAGVYNIFPADLDRLNETRAIQKGIDKILVDAPCSGTGTFRRNPDAKWKVTEDRLQVNHRDQVGIMEKALPHLRKGGKLYYATCSIDPIENEEVVNEILQQHPELSKVSYPVSRDGFFRLMPHKHGTDGFFLAVVQKSTA